MQTIHRKSIDKMLAIYIDKLSQKPILDKNYETLNISGFFNSDNISSLFGKTWRCVLNFDQLIQQNQVQE